MTVPLTSAVALKEVLSSMEAGVARGQNPSAFLMSEADVAALVPVSMLHSDMIKINALVENIAVSEQCASLLSARDTNAVQLQSWPAVHGVQIQCAGEEITFSVRPGDMLDRLGVANVIQYATVAAIDQFMQLRLAEVGMNPAPAMERLRAQRIELPTRIAVAIPADRASEFLGECERASESIEQAGSPKWFYAKRIDYLVGHQYIPGRIVDLPICGGISNVVFKSRLGVAVDSRDCAQLTRDAFLIISIAALPVAPATSWLAMGGWIAANATFGALTEGVSSYVANGEVDAASKSALKGALLGAMAGGAGIAAKGLLAPASASPLAAAMTSGATVGSVTAGSEAFIRVVERGDDVATAAKEVTTAAAQGLVGGGLIGGGTHLIANAVSSLGTHVTGHLTAGDWVGCRRFEEYRDLIEPMAQGERSLHMGDVRIRSRQLDARLDDFAAYLKETDPQFGKHVDIMRETIADAVASKDSVRLAKLEKQITIGLSGEFAEARVKEVFRPYFGSCTVQKRVQVQDGATVIDMVFADAKQPLAIKGLRLVEKGGTLPLEVKAASAEYFQREIKSGHLLRQLDGHKEFGKGLVVTTRDVNQAFLGPGGGRELIKQRDAAVYRLLPLKSDIDAAMKRLVWRDPRLS